MRILKITILLFLTSIICFLTACRPSIKNDKQNVNSSQTLDTQKSPLYNYDWPLPKIRNTKKTDVHIPFHKDSKYFIADKDGKPISPNQHNSIQLDPEYPFYWVKKSDKYYLFTYPEEQVIIEGFDRPLSIEFARSRLSFVDNINSSFIYYTLNANTNEKGFRPWYFFTINSKMVSKSKYAPLTFNHEMGCKNLKSTHQPAHSKYLIVFDENCKMFFVDKNGKEVNKFSFTNFKRFKYSEDYLLIGEGQNPQLLFDYSQKEFIEFPYQNIEPIKELDGYFTGKHIEKEKGDERLVIDNKGKVVYSYLNGREMLPGGLLFRHVENNYELFDVIKKKTVVKAPIEKFGSLKEIKKVNNEFYFISYDSKVLNSEGVELEIAPWQTRPTNERERLTNKFKSTYSSKNNIKISSCIFNQYYIVTMDDLQGLIKTDGTILVDFDKIKIVALNPDRFLWKGINIYKKNDEFQLNENLELTRFPYKEIFNRVKIDHTKLKRYSKAYKDWKWVNYAQLRNGYLIFQDGSLIHIYETSGKHLSSHKGTYRNTLSSFSQANHKKDTPYFSNFIELTRTSDNENGFKSIYLNIETGKEFFTDKIKQ